jgi:hypothetical protein
MRRSQQRGDITDSIVSKPMTTTTNIKDITTTDPDIGNWPLDEQSPNDERNFERQALKGEYGGYREPETSLQDAGTGSRV